MITRDDIPKKLLKILEAFGVVDAFIMYYNNASQDFVKVRPKMNPKEDISDSIIDSFLWENTQQGHRFWRKLHYYYKASVTNNREYMRVGGWKFERNPFLPNKFNVGCKTFCYSELTRFTEWAKISNVGDEFVDPKTSRVYKHIENSGRVKMFDMNRDNEFTTMDVNILLAHYHLKKIQL